MPHCWKSHIMAHLCMYVYSHVSSPVTALVQLYSSGLTLPLAIVAICYKKCRVATNISHWLKVHSRWFKSYISAKKCILIGFWIFQYCFYYSSTLYYCAIFYSLDAGFFFNTIRVSKSLDPDQAWQFVRPDLGPNCLQRLSADSWQRVKYRTTSWYYLLAKT